MGFFKRFLINYEIASRQKVLVELRNMNANQLEAVGISTERLKLGVAGWPWTADSKNNNNRRINEKQTMSALIGTQAVNNADHAVDGRVFTSPGDFDRAA